MTNDELIDLYLEWSNKNWTDRWIDGDGHDDAFIAGYRAAEPRMWAYGLTADEWFHLASEGHDSEVTPCCGNLGEIRDLIRTLLQFQADDEFGWRKSVGAHLIEVVESDGEGHGLQDRESFPLLHRVQCGGQGLLPQPRPVDALPQATGAQGAASEPVAGEVVMSLRRKWRNYKADSYLLSVAMYDNSVLQAWVSQNGRDLPEDLLKLLSDLDHTLTRDPLQRTRKQVAWLLWCLDQGYENPADRAILHNWLDDDPATLHPDDAKLRPHLLGMADAIIAAVRRDV